MKFELRPTYSDWPENDRKSLHVDPEAFAAIKAICDQLEINGELHELLPADVLTELKRPMYGPGRGDGSVQLWGMNVVVDER
jgi:hypothetical protein